MKKLSVLKVLASISSLFVFSIPVQSAGATGESGVESFEISEKIVKKTDCFSPDIECSFTISTEENTARTKTLINDTETGWYWGKEGLISFSDSSYQSTASILFSPELSETGLSEVKKELPVYINTAMLDSDSELKPNVYRFRITESTTDFEGLINDQNTERFVYLYIVYKNGTDISDGLKVEKAVTTYEKDGREVKTDSLEWSKDFDSNTYELRLKKKVTGNMGDKNADFNFTLNIAPSDEGEKYLLSYISPSGKAPVEVTGGKSVSILLKHGEEIAVSGLSKSDAVKISEDDYSDDGYTTSDSAENITDTSADPRTFSGSLVNDPETSDLKATVEFVNDKEVPIAMGVVREYGAYIGLTAISLAGGTLLCISNRKNRKNQ